MLSTATKVRIARAVASALLRAGVRPMRQIRRRGIVYEIDLREGIDLSLFLFGAFQRHLLGTVQRFVPRDGVVLDIGANIGSFTLPAAAYLRNGHVYAFEPTDFAFSKLRRNCELNPRLNERVTLSQSFVGESSSNASSMIAYSSWPLIETNETVMHPIHRGVAKAASPMQTTIDAFVADRALTRLSLIKIDTDGHEFAVLSGALDALRRYRPVVIFEACEYLMAPPSATFVDYVALLRGAGYRICADASLRPIDAEQFRATCPSGGGLDLIAVPDES